MGFVSQVRETLALSSVDAQPFIPAGLKGLFGQQPRMLWQEPAPLAPLFQPRCDSGCSVVSSDGV